MCTVNNIIDDCELAVLEWFFCIKWDMALGTT